MNERDVMLLLILKSWIVIIFFWSIVPVIPWLISLPKRLAKPPCPECGSKSKFKRFTSYTGLDEFAVYVCLEQGHRFERG